MGITTGSIIEIIDRQSIEPDLVLNVYHYRVDSGILTVPAAEIAEFWWNDCGDVIRGMQSDRLKHIRVSCRNLDNSADYGEYIIPEAEQEGTQDGVEALSRQSAFSISFRPTEPTVRPGGKRIGGIPETANGELGLITAPYLALLQDYGDHMIEELNDVPNLAVYTPVIVGLPNDDRPNRIEVGMQGYVIHPYISTQNTRKSGRGA